MTPPIDRDTCITLWTYKSATDEQALLLQQAADASEHRKKALARLHERGFSYQAIADLIGNGITRSRVQQLAERGRQ